MSALSRFSRPPPRLLRHHMVSVLRCCLTQICFVGYPNSHSLLLSQCSSGKSLPFFPNLQPYLPKRGKQKVPVCGEPEVREFREEEKDMLQRLVGLC